MRFYLAHNYAAREWLKEHIVPILEREGHTVTSRWLYLPEAPTVERSDYALRDLEDVRRADALLLFNENFGERPGRGKYVEFGYAFGLHEHWAKGSFRIFVIGKAKDCLFYVLPGVEIFETFDEFYAAITQRIGLRAK